MLSRNAKGLKKNGVVNFHRVLTNKISQQNFYRIIICKANGGFLEGMPREDTNT